jgi:hypothetical protein
MAQADAHAEADHRSTMRLSASIGLRNRWLACWTGFRSPTTQHSPAKKPLGGDLQQPTVPTRLLRSALAPLLGVETT